MARRRYRKKHAKRSTVNYVNPLIERFGIEFFRNIPNEPGVYLMRSSRRKTLYIGKAKSLKNRLATYSRITPDKAHERTVELIHNVHSIEWVVHPTEQEAIRHENQLIHSVRPPFNIVAATKLRYLFIGVRKNEKRGLDFQLSTSTWIEDEGYQVYGCFPNRRLVKDGYTALLRLLFSVDCQKQRFLIPGKISSKIAPWNYTSPFRDEWREPLDHFLRGKNSDFLGMVCEALIENEFLPPFMRPTLQDDIHLVKKFYLESPESTELLKQKHGIDETVLSHAGLDQLIALDCDTRVSAPVR